MSDDADQPSPDRRHLVSQRLRARRRALGLTQQQVVARLGQLGLSTTNRALSSCERGAGLDVSKLPELATALDCSVTYLLGLTDDPRRWHPDPHPRLLGDHPRPRAAPAGTGAAAGRSRTYPPILSPDVPDFTSPAAARA